MDYELNNHCRDLARTLASEPDEFVGRYFDADQAIRKALFALRGVKTDLPFDFSKLSQRLLRASLVMSDVTCLSLKGGDERVVVFASDKSPKFPLHVRAPANLIEKHDIETNNGIPLLRPGASMRWDATAKAFVEELAPLIHSGLVIPRPNMMLLALKRQAEGELQRTWKQIDVATNHPSSIWIVEPPRIGEAAIPVEVHPDAAQQWRQIANITIPYMEGIALSELAKVLTDEHDLVAALRRSIRELIDNANSEQTQIQDLYNDVVRPATDKVNRKFRDISNIRAIRMSGAAVSSIGLVLSGLFGIAEVSSALLLGAGGLSMLLAREYAEFIKDKRDLRDDPFYLLWRIRSRRTGGTGGR